MVNELKKFTIADKIKTEEDMLYLLDTLLESNDSHLFTLTLRDVAKSEGMSKLAERTGIPRESLYRILSESGNPRLETLMRVLDGLGLSLSLRKTAEYKETSEEESRPASQELAYT
ncbi:addiction module antidote protein [Alloscardovia criceti]|uniref:addiction module antidote protein n=1 Tax=Alloscardovia criceti TaxID=356828 RepID=UPI00035C6B63|nr:addiction module antidote protein [Alloscardovia criceti]